ncbi:hypothetical protein Tco_0226207 [Tanacetum coccineum]
MVTTINIKPTSLILNAQTEAQEPDNLKHEDVGGVVRFGKRGKLNPGYVGPFRVMEKVGSIAYKLELPQELSRVRWNSRRGPEFTWEHEDQFWKKYLHLFTETTPSASVTS